VHSLTIASILRNVVVMKILKIQYQFTLSEFAESQGSMKKASAALGLSPDVVRKMLASDRQIYVKKIKGQWHHNEIIEFKRGPRS